MYVCVCIYILSCSRRNRKSRRISESEHDSTKVKQQHITARSAEIDKTKDVQKETIETNLTDSPKTSELACSIQKQEEMKLIQEPDTV